MPMPPTLPQKWGIPGSEDVRLGRFGFQRLDHPGIHHPPLQQLAPPPIPVDRVEVSSVLPPTQEKQNTWEPPTPAAVRTVTCTQTGRWEASSGIRRDRWETTDPGVRTSSFAARAWCATSRAAAF